MSSWLGKPRGSLVVLPSKPDCPRRGRAGTPVPGASDPVGAAAQLGVEPHAPGKHSWEQACAELASRNKVLIALHVVSTCALLPGLRRCVLPGMLGRAGWLQGCRAVLCSVLFSHYFSFFYACPIAMCFPFMEGPSTVNNRVVYRNDERSRRFQWHARTNAEEFVPGSVSRSASSQSLSH